MNAESAKHPNEDVFDRIRAGCETVASNARHVQIVPHRIEPYVGALLAEENAGPLLDTVHHYVADEQDTVAYFVTLDAINFGSGYFPTLRKRPGLSGYFTIASHLTDRFRSAGPISAVQQARITRADCCELFDQDPQSRPINELMGHFAAAWNALGHDLLTRFGGRFTHLIEAAEQSAGRLVEILSAQPAFRDVASYHGVEIPFYKRAQILASDLSLALDGKGLGRFGDLDRLTIFADNVVPHVLRLDGVLRYDPRLLARIEAGQLIPSGSEEEIEMRACALHAVEEMVRAARATGRLTTSRDLDLLLWNRGRHAEYKACPRHRTRTVFY